MVIDLEELGGSDTLESPEIRSKAAEIKKIDPFIIFSDYHVYLEPIHHEGYSMVQCMFHEDNTPSMKVYFDKKHQKYLFYCYSEQRTWDVIDVLVQKGIFKDKVSAVQGLAARYTLEEPEEFTVKNFARFKRLSVEVLRAYNVTECDGKNRAGALAFPTYSMLDGDHLGTKIRYPKKYKMAKFAWDVAVTKRTPTYYACPRAHRYDTSKEIYIAEGYTDTLTLSSLGYQAIGFDNAGTVKSTLDEIGEKLNSFSGVVFVSDNDLAGQQSFKHCVDWALAQDTPCYSGEYSSACKDINEYNDKIEALCPINKLAFDTLSADELKEPKVYKYLGLFNPIDREHIVAQCQEKLGIKKREVIEKLIREGRPKEQHTVGVDIPKGYGVQDGKYVKYDKDGAPMDIFTTTLKVLGHVVTDDGTIKYVIRTSSGKTLLIDHEMTRLAKFKEFYFVQDVEGHFLGTDVDWNMFLAMIKEYGMIKRFNLVKSVGQIYNAMGEPVAWSIGNKYYSIEGKFEDYHNFFMLQGDGYYSEESDNLGIGYVDECTKTPEQVYHSMQISLGDTKRYIDTLKKTYKDKFLDSIGWGVSNYFNYEVFSRFDMFPLLYFSGSKASGKTSFAGIMARMFGYKANYTPMSFASTTYAAMRDMIGRTSIFPLWLDDVRTEDLVADRNRKQTFLLNVFGRSKANKHSDDMTVKSTPIRTGMILSGESFTSDPALASRSVRVQMSQRIWEGQNGSWKYIKQNSDILYKLGFTLMTDSLNMDKRVIYNKCLDEASEMMDGYTCEERTRHVVSVVIAGLLYLRYEDMEAGKPSYGEITDEEIEDVADRMVLETKQTLSETEYVDYFLDTMIASHDNGYPVYNTIFASKGKLCISVQQATQKISRVMEDSRRLNLISSLEHFRGHKYYLEDRTKGSPFSVRVGDFDDIENPKKTTKRGLVFDLCGILSLKPRLFLLLSYVEQEHTMDYLREHDMEIFTKLSEEGVFDD